MHFLEECRKAEEEGKVEQAKVVTKAKVAAATVPLTQDDELSKQLKYQQHQIDALVEQVKNLVSIVKSTQSSSNGARPGGFGRHPQSSWRGGSRGRGLSAQTHSQATLQPRARNPQQEQEAGRTFKCWHCGEVGHLKCECLTLKERGLFQRGNA